MHDEDSGVHCSQRIPTVPLWRREAARVLAGFLLGLLSAGGATSQPVTTDRDALMALYDSTDGPNWARNDNWGSDRPLDEWDGVGTNSSGRVTRLDFTANGMHGPLPAELGNLTMLRELYLMRNHLTGPIPTELVALNRLRQLSLYNNALTGPIPAELGAFARLEVLLLAGNNLTGSIPDELGRLTTLRVLYLGSNSLTGTIPAALGDLVNLEELYLSYGSLTGTIPAELSDLASLRELNLNDNRLTGPVPTWMGTLTNLEELDLSFNELTGPLPVSLTELRELRELNIEGNAGLCAPRDEPFQAWLATVFFRGEVCAAEPVPALPGVGLALTALAVYGLAATIIRRRQCGS